MLRPHTHERRRPRVARWRCAAAAALIALCGATGRSLRADEGPTATVRAILDKASAIGGGTGSKDHDLATVRAVARELVDTRTMGRRALGSAFTSATPAQQEEFLRLFDELVVRSYLQKLLLFREPKFRMRGEAPHGDAVLVTTDVVTSKDAYEVAYEMQRTDGRWLATDIVIEGVGMTSNYSDQFTSLLRDRSFDELLDLMRRKLDYYRSPTPS